MSQLAQGFSHGLTQGADGIFKTGFRIDLAGSARGTMFGKGALEPDTLEKQAAGLRGFR